MKYIIAFALMAVAMEVAEAGYGSGFHGLVNYGGNGLTAGPGRYGPSPVPVVVVDEPTSGYYGGPAKSNVLKTEVSHGGGYNGYGSDAVLVVARTPNGGYGKSGGTYGGSLQGGYGRVAGVTSYGTDRLYRAGRR